MPKKKRVPIKSFLLGRRPYVAAGCFGLLLLLGAAVRHYWPKSSEVRNMSLAEERLWRDANVWSNEVEAQRYERVFVALWDELRSAKDRLAVLEKVNFASLSIATPHGSTEDLELGIRRSRLTTVDRTFTHQSYQEKVRQLKAQGFRIIHTQWHHTRFLPATDLSPARSEVSFVLHVVRWTPPIAYIVRGVLVVAWSRETDAQGHPIADSIETHDVEILSRVGEPPFQYTLTANGRNEPYTSAMPVIVYDLDGDGYSEIILSRWNRVYWNASPHGFREGKFLEHYQPHWETGIVADFNGDAQADFLTVGKGDAPVIYFGAAGGNFPHEGQSCSTVQFVEPSVITAGDVDADGDLDLWMTQYKLAYRQGQMPTPYYDANDGYPSYLLLNDGQGQFSDATEQAGLAEKRYRRTYSSSLVDLDDDGDLDLMVISDFAGLDLYENDGRGRFADATNKWVRQRHLFGMAHTLADYNLDGRTDFFVIGMSSTTARRLDFLGLGRDDRADVHRMRAPMTYGNRMYLSTGDRFLAPSLADQVARSGWSWGTSSFDFDNDGDHDIYVANGFRSGRSSQDYCTRYWCHDVYSGSSRADPEVERLLVDSLRELEQGEISWNGYEHNVLWMNRRGREFVNVAFLLGVAFEYDSRTVISDDLDGDGRCDLLVGEYTYEQSGVHFQLHVYKNNLHTANNWIGLRLREEGPGLSPIGAKVTVKSSGNTQIARIVTGDSFMSQHANTVHFGLGHASEVELIEIQWPHGPLRRLIRPEINRYHTVRPWGTNELGTER